ncbi:starch-binding protein [Natronogracilivirga saccharolytica]|uniref:Starch-binding protein n=1 Tax=Natronogracilivirga saccharolytica TaxID=2812953 RepID=A0A8J7RHT0_9BACT|nr:starch-binding protein [Natronogracilivirga saccharolytica]MBP3191452.1 starch-binding protein [Natronogracilivirga saccharolytica]
MNSKMLRPFTGFLLAFALLFTGFSQSYSQATEITTNWEQSVTEDNLPEWMDGNQRGMAVHEENGNKYLLITSATSPWAADAYWNVRVINAENGDDEGEMSLGSYDDGKGTFRISDVTTTEDNKIFVNNYAEVAGHTAFLVQMFTDLDDEDPVVVLEDDLIAQDGWRIGRVANMTGNFDNGTATLYVTSTPAADEPEEEAILRYTQTGPGENFSDDPEIFEVNDIGTNPSASAALPGEEPFYWTADGRSVFKMDSDGTEIGAIPSEVLGSSTIKVQFIDTYEGNDYIAVINSDNSSAELVRVVDGDPELAEVIGTTPSLGSGLPFAGLGEPRFIRTDDGFDAYVMASARGIGSYSVELLEEPDLNEYDNIADLLDNAEVGEEAVLTNEVIVTFVAATNRNQHYLSDETGAVLVDDDNNVLTGLARGDGITGFTFEFSESDGTTQLLPLADIAPTTSDNDLPYWETTLADLEYVGEPRLMKVEMAQFVDEGDFEETTNYGIIDPTVTSPVTFRTHLSDSDVIGEAIPAGVVNLKGIAAEFFGTPQLYAAHYDLIEEVEVDIEGFALESPEDGAELTVEGSPVDEVVITWERPASNVDGLLHFTWHLDARGDNFDDPIVSIPADGNGNDNQLTLTMGAIDQLLDDNGLDIGDVLEADWTITAEAGDEVVFADAAFAIDLERGEIDTVEFDNLEDFANFPVTAGQYQSGTFEGQDGSTWEYVNARGDIHIDEPTPGLQNNADAKIESGTITGGIAALQFDYMQMFSNDVELDVFVNDELVATVTSDGQQNEVLSSGLIGIPDVEGDFVLRFQNTSSGAQVAVDNVQWLSVEPDPEPDFFTVYYNNPEGWDDVYAYAWEDDGDPYIEWPGELMNEPEEDSEWYSYDVPVNFDMIIFNDNDGNQTDDLSRNTTGWYDGEQWYDEEPVEVLPYETLFQLSTIDETRPDWFSDDHTERGMIAGDDHMYAVSRKDGIFVYVLDNETGEVLDTLNTEGVSGGLFPLNDIEISDNGHLFAANMTLDAGDNAFKVYRMRNGEPEVVLEFEQDGARLGDRIMITGSTLDGGMRLYAGDGNSATVYVFPMNGPDGAFFDEPVVIDLEEVDSGAVPSVAPVGDGTFFWTASGRDVHKFDYEGNHLGSISSDLFPGNTTALRYLGTENGDHMLAGYIHGHSSDPETDEKIRVVRIPDGDLDEAAFVFDTPSMRGAGNPNGTGEVAFTGNPDGTANLYVLGTNNGIGGYHAFDLDLEFPDYSADLDIISIAEARSFDDDRIVVVKGIVNSTDFGFGVADYFIQDETAGLNVTDFDDGGAQSGVYAQPGDSIIIMGEMATFRNQRNIEVMEYEITSSGNDLPEAVAIDGDEMRDDSEYQGMRVQLRDMYIIEEDLNNWPLPGDPVADGSGVNVRVTSEAEADTFVVRLARNNTPWGDDYDGQPMPPAVFHVSGTMGQFNEDTQVFPFFTDDFEPLEDQYRVEFNVDMGGVQGFDPDENHVYLAGSINTPEWQEPGSNPRYRMFASEDDENIYTVTLYAEAGDYEYKYFMVEDEPDWDNSEWPGDPNRMITVDDDKVVNDVWGEQPTSGEQLSDVPTEFGLDQNYPNPFNPVTTIRYQVPESANVTLEVYDVTGQRVATLVNESREAGVHTVEFDATRLASGVYIYRMHAGDFVQSKKLMLVK